jgi:16S rRNA (guanine527-N7)-methyltransferase
MSSGEIDARALVAQWGDDVALDRLDRLAEMLRAENEQQNLVSSATLCEIWHRHIADSAQLLGLVPRGTDGPWLDLGTGAGFPGLVIAALRPDFDVRLVESRRKRVEWLERARLALGLERCQVMGSRLELVEDFPAGVISARAFAPLPELFALSQRFSTERTLWLLPKGRSAAQELSQLSESKRRLFHVEQSRTNPEAGIIVGRLPGQGRKR